ncbi:hypothetical protein BASA60_000995 [Batrachochytrium salamandrivorans]|nr:hypothetical protein BASA60_000995 [Batrachochytrium salamandrivorans]
MFPCRYAGLGGPYSCDVRQCLSTSEYDAQRGQQSQGATSQSEQQYQDDADPNEHEDPRESLQDTLMELNEDYKKRQAAVGQLQGIIDEMEKRSQTLSQNLTTLIDLTKKT